MDDPFAPIESGFAKKPKTKPANRMAGIGFFDDFEIGEVIAEAPVEIAKAGADVFTSVIDLFKTDIIAGGESAEKKPGIDIGGKTEIDFKNQEVAAVKKDFFQKLEADRKELEFQNLEQVMDDLVRLEVGAMSTDEKNKTLHLSADFDEKNIRDPYHLHALRQKKIAQIKETILEQKSVSMAATQPDLKLRLDANEGQSMVSQSGAIMSAG